MLKLCRVDIERSGEVFGKVEKYTERVVETLKPHAVILSGSSNRGDMNGGSDVDLLVIADFKDPFLYRIKLLLDLNDGIGLPPEPLAYTLGEFQRMQKEGNPFIREVLGHGEVLHSKIQEEPKEKYGGRGKTL